MKLKVFIVLVLVSVICSASTTKRLKVIAHDLLAIKHITDFRSNWNSPVEGVVNIGKGLYRIFTNRTVSTDSISIEIQEGDFFNESSKVSHSIIYTSPKSRLGLRMRYDKALDKFHIVGYSGTIE